MEQVIKTAAKLYECRDAAKRFFGDEYPERLKPYRNIIIAVKRAHNLDTIPALLKINKIQDNGLAQMMFMAATIEIIEEE